MALIGVIPFGSCEFHGPHLPSSTDHILAEYFAHWLAETSGCGWQAQVAPSIALGVSEEHLWHPSTLSITAETLRGLAFDVCDAMRRATGVRQFLLLNCHGGNRPALEQVCDDFYRSDHGVETLLVNPVSLVSSEFSTGPVPDVHAGLLETSLLLAIAPDRVDMRELQRLDFSTVSGSAIRGRLARRGVYWPWSSQDPTLAVNGIIGDPRTATAEFGEKVAAAARTALVRVVEDFISDRKKSGRYGDG